jgi:hypothetical protein
MKTGLKLVIQIQRNTKKIGIYFESVLKIARVMWSFTYLAGIMKTEIQFDFFAIVL